MASPSQPLHLSLALSLPPSSLSRSSSAPQPQSFNSPQSLTNLHTLNDFSSFHTLPDGTLLIRPMLDTDTEIDTISRLLSDSLMEAFSFPTKYTELLVNLIKSYLLDRRALLPHVVLLVGFYSHGLAQESSDARELACMAEISFNKHGANAASPTPVPPPDCPYISNMTVKNDLRRKGIGKQLLKSCEELIFKMTVQRDVYLHCRMVDKVPLSMFKKAGYQIVKTDSFLVWLTRQRRKYLLRKTLIDLVDCEAPKAPISEEL